MRDLRKPAKQAWQDSEEKLQILCAEWLKKALLARGLPQLFYHVPNEGAHKVQFRAKQKLMGVKAGVSDVVLPIARHNFHGVYCELKKAGGAPSPDQKEFLKDATNEGYLAVVVNDFDTFKEVFTFYLDNKQ